MKHNRCLCLCLLLTLMVCASSAAAQTEAERLGLALMQKNYQQLTTKNWRSDVLMELVSRSGEVQTRHLKRISKTDDNDLEKFHLRFIDPPAVRNTTLLIFDLPGGESDIWLYLPAIKNIKKLSGHSLRASYMGTEFSYKDLKRENVRPEHNRYVYVQDEVLDGVPHAVIEAFPISDKEKQEQGYQKRRIWLRRDNHLATRIDFYDGEGDHQKTMIGSDLRQAEGSEKSFYHTLTMTNNKGVITRIRFNLLQVDKEDPEDKFFTKTYLQRL